MTSSPDRDLTNLHPIMRDLVVRLCLHLEADFTSALTLSKFQLFEGYRSPERQHELFTDGRSTTKADAWQSAHQYGLAVDFAGRVNGLNGEVWSWNPQIDWAHLRMRALEVGLDVPLDWDKGHVEHPHFKILKRRIRGF